MRSLLQRLRKTKTSIRHGVELHTRASLQYKIGILRNGEIVHETAYKPHMITDVGLDSVGLQSGWCGFLSNCILGTSGSPTPVRRDDGSVTFTQVGNVVTASAPFFIVTSDIGRLFKYGTGSAGTEVYITATASSTVVTVGGPSTTVSTPTAGTVWYVNTAAIITPIAGLTWSRNTSGNSSSYSNVAGVCTATITAINTSSALASNVTVTEIAINDSTTNSNVFDRDLISPPVALLVGDQAVVTIQLFLEYSPTASTAMANVATGYDSSGNFQIESLVVGDGTSGPQDIAANGSVGGGGVWGPASVGVFVPMSSTFTLQPFNTTTSPTLTGGMAFKTGTLAAYGTGNRYRDVSVLFSISDFSGTVRALALTAAQRQLTFLFTTPFAKLSTQTLSFNIRKSWQRVLTN